MFVLLLFFLAVSLAAVAAAFSIYGLIAIFPAVAIGILIGAIVIEVCKLAAISFFYQFYNVLGWGKKLIAATFIVIAMIITSLGVYGFLTKGYIEQTGPLHEYQLRIENIDADITSLRERIDRNNRQIGVLDAALERYIELGAVTRGMQTMRNEHGEDYQRLQQEVSEFQNQIVELNRERTQLRSNLNRVEAEVGPIQYVADLFIRGMDANTARDTALKWFSILIVLAIDPFAVALLVFANHAYAHRNDPRVRREFDFFDKDKKNDTLKLGSEESSTVVDPTEMIEKVDEFLKAKDDENHYYVSHNSKNKYSEIVDSASSDQQPSTNENPQQPKNTNIEKQSVTTATKKEEKDKPSSYMDKFLKRKDTWIGSGKK